MDKEKLTILNHFLTLWKKDERIMAVFLFGSYAYGKPKKSSDIDICIISNENLIENFSCPLKDEGFDVLFFNNLSEVIKYDVITKGKNLLMNNKSEFVLLKRRFLREYMGFTPMREYYWKRTIESV